MADLLLAALADGETVHSCSLATVTTTCVVIRTASARSRAIVSLGRITGMETLKTTYPAFLAVAAGFFLIAAAAYFSKDGGVAHIPLTILGAVSVVAYVVSRRSAIVFWIGRRESMESIRGGVREADHLKRAVMDAQAAYEAQMSATALAS